MKEFYIGYRNDNHPIFKKTFKWVILLLCLLIIAIAFFVSFSQKYFSNSSFELNEDTTLNGIYHAQPYPMLQVQLDNNIYQNILLLGYGKFGAERQLNESAEQSLHNGITLSVTGNLIYYNGKTLLQVHPNKNIKISNRSGTAIPTLNYSHTSNLIGEIIDPKCYFGVMKPGKGKIHKSCAIRCISGGIPPVFLTIDSNGKEDYYLITDQQGQPLKESLIPLIGKKIKLSGSVLNLDKEWKFFQIDQTTIEDLELASTVY